MVVVLILISSKGFGQRGQEYSRKATPANSPGAGYPGFFDTHFADDGSFVLDLPPLTLGGGLPLTPSVGFDYGLSKTTTIGTNLLVDGLAVLLGGIGATAKVRTLIFGNQKIQNALTLYGGYVRLGLPTGTSSSDDDDSSTDADEEEVDAFDASSFVLTYQFVTNNTTWYFDRFKSVTGQVAFGRFTATIGQLNNLSYADISLLLGMLGASYQHFFSERFSLSFAGLFPFFQQAALDSAAASISLNVTKVDTDTALFRMARATANLYAGRWLFDFGLVHMPPFVEGGILIGAAVKW